MTKDEFACYERLRERCERAAADAAVCRIEMDAARKVAVEAEARVAELEKALLACEHEALTGRECGETVVAHVERVMGKPPRPSVSLAPEAGQVSKGGTNMRATGEKPAPVEACTRCVAGICSEHQPSEAGKDVSTESHGGSDCDVVSSGSAGRPRLQKSAVPRPSDARPEPLFKAGDRVYGDDGIGPATVDEVYWSPSKQGGWMVSFKRDGTEESSAVSWSGGAATEECFESLEGTQRTNEARPPEQVWLVYARGDDHVDGAYASRGAAEEAAKATVANGYDDIVVGPYARTETALPPFMSYAQLADCLEEAALDAVAFNESRAGTLSDAMAILREASGALETGGTP